MRRFFGWLFDTFCAVYLVGVLILFAYSTTMPTPTLNRSFQAGLLFVMADGGMLPAQVCTDFDVCKRQLDKMLGGSSGTGSTLWTKPHPLLTDGRVWRIKNEEQYEQVFATFFRPFRATGEVRSKPSINAIALIPVDMDKPFLPNDLGDFMKEEEGGF